MASTINADDGVISGIAGVKTTADSTGALNIQTNGTTAITISAAQAVSLTNSPTFTGGTANGVLFLNASKVATSGTALVFDGTYFTANGLRLAGTDVTNTIYQATGALGITTGTAAGITFATNLTTRMALDGSGNLGIGTTSPVTGSKLTLNGGGLAILTEGTLPTSVGGSTGLFASGYTATGAVIGRIFIGDGLGYTFYFSKRLASTTTDLFTFTDTGNLGIGTTTPSKKLEVANSDALVYGLTVGRGAGAVATNTAVGSSSLFTNSSGSSNASFGYNALYTNGIGAFNSGFGQEALFSNSSGYSNSAFGYYALRSTTGQYNTAVGAEALRSNTTASNNTAVGYQAGYSNTTGATNTLIGLNARYNGTTGSDNVVVGVSALQGAPGTTTGSNNTAIGTNALFSNTTASNNTAVGYQAGYSNLTGISNAYVGESAGRSATGSGNTFIGQDAGYYVTTGNANTILGGYNGNQSGLDIRTASNHIVLSDGDGNTGMYARYIASNNVDVRPGQSNHAVAYLGESGSINSGSSVAINVNGSGGDGSGGFIFITTAASDGSIGYDTTNMCAHTHGNSYNTYATLSVYSTVNSITMTNPIAGSTTISNNSGKTIKYQSRYLNMGSRNITLA